MAIAVSPPSPLISSTIVLLTRLTQSHSTLPLGERTSRARWPMPKWGLVPIPSMAASSRNVAIWVALSLLSVVQAWPVGGTNWRSSSQIGQALGAFSEGENWVPHVMQMNASMAKSRVRTAARPYTSLITKHGSATGSSSAAARSPLDQLGQRRRSAHRRRARRQIGQPGFSRHIFQRAVLQQFADHRVDALHELRLTRQCDKPEIESARVQKTRQPQTGAGMFAAIPVETMDIDQDDAVIAGLE